MAKGYFFQDLHLTNFRLFRKLDIKEFNRINIIGGFNGAGKSALLETLFCLIDINHPLSFVKPYNFRGTNLSGSEGIDLIFQDQSSPAKIEYASVLGRQIIKIGKSKLPDSAISAISSNMMGGPVVNSSSLFANQGVKIEAGKGSNLFEAYLAPYADGFTGTIVKLGETRLPSCQLLSANMRISPVDLAAWLSDCIKSGRIDTVVDHLRILDPSIVELKILYNGQNPTIYASRGSEMIPVDLLGDGFRHLLTTILTIVRMEKGIVLLDEIDTALHYSVTSKFWSIIAKAAVQAECQIFATSHSREAILSAAKGIEIAGCRKEFCYMRLEKVEGDHNVVAYSMDEIETASEYGFEFR